MFSQTTSADPQICSPLFTRDPVVCTLTGRNISSIIQYWIVYV